MKPELSSPRYQTTPTKINRQANADFVSKRAVTFNEVTVERKPVMRTHATEKMQKTMSENCSSEESDGAASSSGSQPESRPVARRETYRFQASWETVEKFSARKDRSGSVSGTASAPCNLPASGEHYPRPPKLVLRVPNFSAPVSMKPSPVGSPRAELEHESQRTPGRLGSFRKLGRELSRKLENISITSRSDKSSASGSSCGNTPRTPQKTDPLAGFAPGHLDALARRIHAVKNDATFQSLPNVIKKVIVKAEILESLPSDSPLRNAAGLVLLLEEVNKRIAVEQNVLDTDIDLNDPAFSKFVASAAHAAFIKPWEHDSSDVGHTLRGYLGEVKPTFARDFDNSDYFFRQADGSLKKLTSIDMFLACVKPAKPDANRDLPKVVSNIASQNLGNFLKNALFLRQDINGVSQSVLRSSDGTPLMPLAVVKATYVLSKDANDAIIIDYTWSSSAEINGAKEMRAKEMMGDFKNSLVENGSLEIKARVRVEASGEWAVFDPHIRAKGWV